MARNTLTLLLFVTVSIALFGFIEGGFQRNEGQFTPPRKFINTPLEYERLQTGWYPHTIYNSISIESGAHENILEEAKRWPHTLYSEIEFTDTYRNVLVFRSLAKTLFAHFTHGENLLANLPRNYRTYDIQVTDEALVTDADIEAIAQWKSAITIKIVDANGVSLGLVERADELK